MARFVLNARRMRFVFVLALAACGTTPQFADETCPAMVVEGDACSFSGRCWQPNNFSSCLSAWCTCSAGTVTCAPVAPREGDACGDEPMTDCGYEGTPTCDTPPTAEACRCEEDGVWHCTCACYGGRSTCAIDPCNLSAQKLQGAACGDPAIACTAPWNSNCRCEQGLDGNLTFNCR